MKDLDGIATAGIILVFICLVIFCFGMAFKSYVDEAKRDAVCEAKGGVPYRTLCLNKDTVIDLRS